ncbi:ImmA/IrrE family metallo-endopeptidase [Solirubrobacter sp. CPCC 204708]|uniref:ImmA/IrrE family metallo-endopeptidase n=1 Tax=Solirubrobacter deserti TaxID=2282478 RepID=A0ABT4RLN8_9ACTN|nr:ImmA/IrrE family metallo-endopeptidase [Solirubrobacter deserti]MBE2320405.1 ImmA/IrrE family metallo-endopeptidase [Solirubrobacter deserti]MDA0139400.1 ImmA/IrrE family metallo-endopeptidase [Solirubrobacter deserti]
MARGELVPIRPVVLQWAMDEAGVSRRGLANALKVDVAKVDAWLAGTEQPTTTQFRGIATHVKRSTSTLLLAQPPAAGVPPSFRHPAGSTLGRTITREESAAVRSARRVQTVAHWILERTEHDEQHAAVPTLEALSDPAEAAKTLRAWLDWSEQVQFTARNQYEALNEMRTRLEERGVLVLHLRMGKDGCRGFSLPDPLSPVIAVNRTYIPAARLFSYVHELVHLATRTEAMCMTTVGGNQLEAWCEAVAGNLLLPEDATRRFIQRELGVETVSTVTQVARVANRFRLSQRGTAYRLQLAGLGVGNLFAMVHAATDLPVPRDDDSGPRERTAVRQYRQLGAAFSSLMLEAESRRLLSSHDVLDYLEIPAAQLNDWRTLARGEPTAA